MVDVSSLGLLLQNVKLLQQFISPHTGMVYDPTQTGKWPNDLKRIWCESFELVINGSAVSRSLCETTEEAYWGNQHSTRSWYVTKDLEWNLDYVWLWCFFSCYNVPYNPARLFLLSASNDECSFGIYKILWFVSHYYLEQIFPSSVAELSTVHWCKGALRIEALDI